MHVSGLWSGQSVEANKLADGLDWLQRAESLDLCLGSK